MKNPTYDGHIVYHYKIVISICLFDKVELATLANVHIICAFCSNK